MSIEPIQPITPLYVNKVLATNKLTNEQKFQFLKENMAVIKSFNREEINMHELKEILKSRPLIRFRPLKNSFTKQGDKKLLSKALGIEPSQVDGYINSMVKNGIGTDINIPVQNVEKVKSYVFRHGTKSQVIKFLEYELSDTKNVLTKLYKTMEENSGGLYDYYQRPIHRMSNNNLRQVYAVIENALKTSEKAGDIDKEALKFNSEWALVKVYEIQNNSKIIRAYNKYQELK